MFKEYDHPREHWSPWWLIWGRLVATAIWFAIFILFLRFAFG